MKLKVYLPFLALAIISIAWFTILIPWNLFPDPDALYHAAMAKLTWESGPVKDLPWLDLTMLGQHFADQHFLLHLLQSPIIAWLGIPLGSRLTSITFAVLAILVILVIFYKLKLKPFWLWPLLLLFTQPFCTRLVQGKASPLAILLWLTMSGSILWLLMPKNHAKKYPALAIIFISSLAFTLTHGGWILLILTAVFIFLGVIIFDVFVHQKRFSVSFRQSPWQPVFLSCAGIGLGLLAHPDRADLWQFLWVQVVQIGIKTPLNLHMGMEWAPASFFDMLGALSFFGLAVLLVVAGLIFARKKDLPQHLMRPIISWSLVCAFLFALTIKSVRFAEYFQPALAVWVAMITQFIDWKKLLQSFQLGQGKLSQYYFPGLIVFCFFVIFLTNTYGAYSSLHNAGIFRNDQYQTAMQAIADNALPNDRVFHASWDEFPVIFAQNQNLKYISGLDPNFLYQTSSTLAQDYANLTFNTASTTQDQAWNLIHDRMQAKFIMLDTERWQDLQKLINSDPRYNLLITADGSAAYEVR